MKKLSVEKIKMFFITLLKVLLISSLTTGLACSKKENKILKSLIDPAEKLKCLSDYSNEEMENIFLDSFFPPDRQSKASSEPITLWINDFATYRARGLYEEFGIREWINFEADLKYLNGSLLKSAKSINPKFKPVEKVLKVTYFSKHIDLSSTQLKNYRLPAPDIQAKLEKFQASNKLCESWHEQWDTRGGMRDRFNVLVSIDTPESIETRDRISVASCFIYSMFKEIGFDNISAIDSDQLLVKQEKSIVDFTELTKWLFWIRFYLEQHELEITSRENLNKDISKLLDISCNI